MSFEPLIHKVLHKILEKRMEERGYLEGSMMASAFHALRPMDLIWSTFVRNYLLGHAPPVFDLLFWNMDTTNMPAKMHSQYLRWMYLNNDLIKPNKIVLNHTSIAIQTIDAPVFFWLQKKIILLLGKVFIKVFKLCKDIKHSF